MMASKKSGTRGAGAPRRGGRPSKNKLMPYVVLVAVLVVASVAGILLLGKPASKRPPTESGEVRAKSRRTKVSAKSRREERRSRERPARVRRERKPREPRRRREGRAARKQSSSSNSVEAILTDESGQRYVLVGNRQLKVGDAVSGRQIVNIGSDQITVEYHGKTYSVRVGQSVY